MKTQMSCRSSGWAAIWTWPPCRCQRLRARACWSAQSASERRSLNVKARTSSTASCLHRSMAAIQDLRKPTRQSLSTTQLLVRCRKQAAYEDMSGARTKKHWPAQWLDLVQPSRRSTTNSNRVQLAITSTTLCSLRLATIVSTTKFSMCHPRAMPTHLHRGRDLHQKTRVSTSRL